jgi:hypothetical protein
MADSIRDLSKYSQEDIEKSDLIKGVLAEYSKSLLKSDFKRIVFSKKSFDANESYSKDVENIGDFGYDDHVLFDEDLKFSKYCPKCGRRYPKGENVCFDCLVHLKNLGDKVDVCDIESNPQFAFTGSNNYDSFENLLSEDNLLKINEFDFTIEEYRQILHDIKSQAFKNFDELIKANEIDFDSLDIADKIILFTKSFVKVEYKSSGGELGYFERDTIFVDDRQTKSLQITTMLHELSHFLIKEILGHILCTILDASTNSLIDALTTFILSYAPFTQLIDEYSAHNVEGRFTIFGFQDYSSFIQIERALNGEMTGDEIEIVKSIGNTFAISIKEILESIIDKPLRDDIKDQFLKDTLDRPNYKALEMENCQILNDEGFIKAIWLILNDGCVVASSNITKLYSILDK